MPKTCRLLVVAFSLAIATTPAPPRTQLRGNTGGSTVSGFGIDDVNMSTLDAPH
jgi:hypothetical protein